MVGLSAAAKRFRTNTYGQIDEDVKKDIQIVTATLADECHAVPARSMLLAGAMGALAEPANKRHKIQEMVCTQIRDAFDSVAADFATRNDAVRASVQRCTAEDSMHNVKQQAAEQELKDALKHLKEREGHLAETHMALQARKECLEEAQKTLTTRECEKHKAEKEVLRIKEIKDGNFELLLSGAWEDPADAKKATDALLADLTSVGIEVALLNSAPAVLGKKPAERKGFDDLVLQAVQSFVTEKSTNAGQRLSEACKVSDAAQVEVETCRCSVAASSQSVDDAANAVANAAKRRDELALAFASLGEACEKGLAATQEAEKTAATLNESIAAFVKVREVLDGLLSRTDDAGKDANAHAEEGLKSRLFEAQVAGA